MPEKRTLSHWLRSEEVYRSEGFGPGAVRWRDALLEEFEHGVVAPLPTRSPEVPEAPAPLQFHHLVLLAPAGLALFGLGWLIGSGSPVVAQVARVSPLVWIVVAVAASAGLLFYRGVGLRGWR